MKLTTVQRNCLEVVAEMEKYQIPTTRVEIAKRLNCTLGNSPALLRRLTEKGAVKEIKLPGGRQRRAAYIYKTINYTPTGKKDFPIRREDGVLECPKRYCSGYGFDNSEIAGIRV